MSSYQKPKVWVSPYPENQITGNRSTAGARFSQSLPKGNSPYQVYSLPTPNGQKVTILLEELKALGLEGVDYDLFKIDITKGDQFGSDFVAFNPNSKIPLVIDTREGDGLALFESGSILLYLAEKHQAFIPKDPVARAQCLNWVFWQMGAGPFLGGGFGHFFTYAPEALEYPINRFSMEAKRQLDLLDKHLATHTYMVGDDYTIADMMIWPWYGRLAFDQLYPGAHTFLGLSDYKHLKRWADQVYQRPGLQKGLSVDYQSIDQ